MKLRSRSPCINVLLFQCRFFSSGTDSSFLNCHCTKSNWADSVVIIFIFWSKCLMSNSTRSGWRTINSASWTYSTTKILWRTTCHISMAFKKLSHSLFASNGQADGVQCYWSHSHGNIFSIHSHFGSSQEPPFGTVLFLSLLNRHLWQRWVQYSR